MPTQITLNAPATLERPGAGHPEVSRMPEESYPEDWPDCRCGCGQPAPPCQRNVPSRGIKRGDPQRFILGHYRKRTLWVLVPLFASDDQVAAYTKVDAADVPLLGGHSWGLTRRYVSRTVGTLGTEYLARRLMGLGSFEKDTVVVDHINRDPLDNRRSNLRLATQQENSANVPARQGGTSRYRGVSWNTACRKWVAAVGVQGRLQHLGLFGSEREAAEVAEAFRLKHLPGARPELADPAAILAGTRPGGGGALADKPEAEGRCPTCKGVVGALTPGERCMDCGKPLLSAEPSPDKESQ